MELSFFFFLFLGTYRSVLCRKSRKIAGAHTQQGAGIFQHDETERAELRPRKGLFVFVISSEQRELLSFHIIQF